MTMHVDYTILHGALGSLVNLNRKSLQWNFKAYSKGLHIQNSNETKEYKV